MAESAENSAHILAVDDNEEGLFTLEALLVKAGYQVTTAEDGKKALELSKQLLPDLILSDVVMPNMSGFELAEAIKRDKLLKYTPIVLLTSKDSLSDITIGLERGADDYIAKPFKSEELLARLKAALRIRSIYKQLHEATEANAELRSHIEERWRFDNIIGQSPPMREIYSLITKVSDAEVPVLVTGESGTGKELVARALHFNSERKQRPFIVQNCSAFSEYLLESELFGHVKGAFTGAHRDKAGLFEAANGGTFFLDEIGEMSIGLQAKLLRVLQDGTFTPVGATSTKTVDVRIVAATNRDLLKMIGEGRFREDLYYRLNVINLVMPPLRERKTDIPLLIEHFLNEYARRNSTSPKKLTDEVLVYLCSYNWPGNIRELQNEIERMLLMSADEDLVKVKHLSQQIRQDAGSDETPQTTDNLKESVALLEKQLINKALIETEGNKSEAARKLGISRSSLITKVKDYKIVN